MNGYIKQQIIVSGVGGQGVLFITRILAEAALCKGVSVLTSETHGMAQRGGTVLSHLKVGNFSSPLIRSGNANGLIALKADGLFQHGFYLKSGGWVVLNCSENMTYEFDGSVFTIDADLLAQRVHNPKSVNLILLGFAMAVCSKKIENSFFFSIEDIKAVLKKRLAGKKKMLDDAIKSVETGFYGV